MSKIYNIDPEHAELAEARRRGHEARDIGFRQFFLLGVGLLVVGLVGNVVLLFLFQAVQRQQEQRDVQLPPLARATQIPPEPRLQVSPEQDWEQMLARHNELLTTYGWADQTRQTVRIPVERAMELVLERGLLEVRPDAGQFPAEQVTDGGAQLESEGGQPPASP